MAGNSPHENADPRPGRVATQQDFGRELTIARQRAGLTVREVARSAGLPASTAGDYFSGRHLPPPGQPGLHEILRACGETGTARLQEWTSALARARRAPGRRASGSRAPYRGLESFQQADAAWFFGRAEVTERLVALTEAAADGIAQAGFAGVPLVVVGPSGSGKSSLLRAGLISRLLGEPGQADGGDPAAERPAGTGNGQPTAAEAGQPALRPNGQQGVVGLGQPSASRALALFTPGSSPLAELGAQLRSLAVAGSGEPPVAGAAEIAELAGEIGPASALPADPAGTVPPALAGRAGRPVIVVDQFEEAFTDCQDEGQRQAFIRAVCALSGPAVVVLALRADFYDRALRYAELATALQERQVVLGPMSPEQVRSAIVEPARLMRLDVEDGLVEVLLRDLAPMTAHGSPPGAAHDAGALPLLSHALLATWEHSRGGKLLVADYQASGGIRDAIARTAEKIYAGLARDQQEIARRIFLRLVHVADDAPDTRSTVALSDLPGLQDGSPASDLLGRFVAERLITMDAETAQISHDALLTAWPRLRAWIDTDHENLMIRRRIRESALAWAEAGQDDAALLRGSRLAIARSWAADQGNRASLGQLAQEFVDTSVTGQHIRQRAARNRSKRLHRLAAAFAALALVTVSVVGYAFQQRQAAGAARDNAMAALDKVESHAVAIEAGQLRAQDVALASQLGLAAYRLAATPDARASLLDSSGMPAAGRLADSASPVRSVSLSPGRRVLAVAAADGTLRLWEVARARRPAPLGGPLLAKSSEPLYAAAFSPDGRILAAAGAGKTVSLWNVSNPGDPVNLGVPPAGPGSTVYSLAFSPDERILAAGRADNTVRLWNMAGPGRPRSLATLTGAAGYVESVAFSRDGKTLAAGSADATVRLWDLADPARPRPLGRPLRGPAGPVTSVAFSPDGQLAAGSGDHKVWLWNVAKPGRPVRAGPPLAGAANWVNAVAFSPDGQLLAAGSSDADVRVWNLATRQLTAVLPHPQLVTSLAWAGPGHLVSGDADGFARIWKLPSPVLQAGAPVNDVAYSPGGGMLAVGSTDLQLWNPRTRQRLAAGPVSGPGPGRARIVNAVAFAPGGQLLAAGYGNGMIQLWRAAAAGPLVPLGRPVPASASSRVESVAFSPDGRILATGGDGTMRLWSVSDPARPRPLATAHSAGLATVLCAAFSPSGHILAAAGSDGRIRLWDVASPAHPRPLGKPLAGSSSYPITVAFSPHGRTLAVGSADKTVRLWSVSDRARPQLLGRPLTGPAGNVNSVAFSPDGNTLAAGVTDGTAWLWDVRDLARPSLWATLAGPARQVYSVAFGQGGRTLAAGSADGTVRLWDTSPAAAARAVCAVSGQPLTRAEWASYIPDVAYHPSCR